MESLIAPAAILYSVLAAAPFGMQLGLAAGAPWGHLTLGGAHPGRLPPRLRKGAVVQAALLAAMALTMMGRGGVLELGLAPWAGWLALALTAMTMVANLITPSRPERLLWGPVSIGMFLSGLVVVIGG